MGGLGAEKSNLFMPDSYKSKQQILCWRLIQKGSEICQARAQDTVQPIFSPKMRVI